MTVGARETIGRVSPDTGLDQIAGRDGWLWRTGLPLDTLCNGYVPVFILPAVKFLIIVCPFANINASSIWERWNNTDFSRKHYWQAFFTKGQLSATKYFLNSRQNNENNNNSWQGGGKIWQCLSSKLCCIPYICPFLYTNAFWGLWKLFTKKVHKFAAKTASRQNSVIFFVLFGILF